MHFPAHLLVPLACGFVYVVGALGMKRAAELGAGVWRATFVANWAMGLGFMPLWLLGGRAHPWEDYWQPAVAGLLFVVGQLCIYLAISRGDVSVTTPVMGTKSIWVALLASGLFAQSVSMRWWIAAGLGAAAVLLLGTGGAGARRRIVFTVGMTTLSALAYALSDLLIQQWLPAWGAGRFIPLMFGMGAIFSLGFVPFFRGGLGEITAPAWRWLAPSAAVMAVNNAGIALTIGRWGDATAVNIVYGSRGLWSVLVVWGAGHWFGNEERRAGGRVMRFRLAGAALMVAAIVLVMT